jgi:hypothetical protein
MPRMTILSTECVLKIVIWRLTKATLLQPFSSGRRFPFRMLIIAKLSSCMVSDWPARLGITVRLTCVLLDFNWPVKRAILETLALHTLEFSGEFNYNKLLSFNE